MNHPLKKISFFALAVIVGTAAFGVVWLPKAAAAVLPCSADPATICYKGSNYFNVPASLQVKYLAGGGSCGACGVSPN